MPPHDPASAEPEESEAESRAYFAEMAFTLLRRATETLAREYEAARPGGFPDVNRRLMHGVVQDLTAIGKELPKGIVGPDGLLPPAFGVVASTMRDALFGIEETVCAPRNRRN